MNPDTKEDSENPSVNFVLEPLVSRCVKANPRFELAQAPFECITALFERAIALLEHAIALFEHA